MPSALSGKRRVSDCQRVAEGFICITIPSVKTPQLPNLACH